MWDHTVSTCTQACPCVYLRACVNVFLPVCLLTCKRVLKHVCACAHMNTCVSPACLCMYPHRCAHMPSDPAMTDPRAFLTPPSLPAQHCCISNPGKSLAHGDSLSPSCFDPSRSGLPPKPNEPSKNQDTVEEIPPGHLQASGPFPGRSPALSGVGAVFLEGAPGSQGQEPGPRVLGRLGAGSAGCTSSATPLPSSDRTG